MIEVVLISLLFSMSFGLLVMMTGIMIITRDSPLERQLSKIVKTNIKESKVAILNNDYQRLKQLNYETDIILTGLEKLNDNKWGIR